MKKNTSKKREFITLEVSTIGFVVYGLGAGAKDCIYRGKPLPEFLERLFKRLVALKTVLNKIWSSLDKEDPENRCNRAGIRKILATAAWAYATILEIQHFAERCVDGPTNPLRHFWLTRLEEIYTKCFAAAHLYGSPDERMVGLCGLLTDFEVNGGIDHKTHGEGRGFDGSLMTYYCAYFSFTNREPFVYERFGELMEAIASLIVSRYPKVAESFGEYIARRIEDTPYGFGSKEVQSPAKTIMLEKLEVLKSSLLKKQASKAA